MPSLARRLLSLGAVLLPLTGLPVFATAATAAVLSAPTNLAPDNSGDNSDDPTTWWKDPILSWTPVTGATQYTVEVSPSSDWTDASVMVSLPADGVTTVPAFALPQTLEHANYFWRVRAENGSAKGPWAQAQLYRGWDDHPATVASPGTDTTAGYGAVSDAPWRFSWSAIPDASSYEIEFSDNPDFSFGTSEQGKTGTTVDCLTQATTFTPYSSVIGADANVDDCTIDPAAFGSTVYWRVRGIDDSEIGENGPATLQCAGLSTTAVTATTESALGSPSSAAQECSMWSAARVASPPTFTTVGGAFDTMTAPSSFALNCPQASTVYDCTAMPELSWQPVPGALSYRVTIADDAAFTSIERVYETPFLTLTPRDQLPDRSAGNGYSVSVQACTDADASDQSCGPASAASFRKVTPAVSGLTSAPIAGGVVLQWNDLLGRYDATTVAGDPAVEAEQYRVQVAHKADTDFSAPVLTDEVDRGCGATGTAGCYRHRTVGEDPGPAQDIVTLPDGTYRWRVVPIDLSGNHLPASAAKTLTVDTTPPVLRLTDSDGVPVDGNLHISASEPVTGVSGSTLHVVSATTGDTVAGTVNQVAARAWTFNPSGALVTGDSYKLQVGSGIQDGAGNVAVVGGNPVRTTLLADDDSAGWSYSGGWSRHSDSGAVGNHYVSTTAGNGATVHVVGDQATVIGCKAPSLGKVRISVDGKQVAAVDEHQSFTQCDVVLWHGPISSTKVHTIHLAVGTGGGALDAVRVG